MKETRCACLYAVVIVLGLCLRFSFLLDGYLLGQAEQGRPCHPHPVLPPRLELEELRNVFTAFPRFQFSPLHLEQRDRTTSSPCSSACFSRPRPGMGLRSIASGETHFFSWWCLATIMISFEAIVVPLFILVRRSGMQNTYWGLIIPESLTAFGVFMMRQFFYSLPDDFIEARRIDGANEYAIFSRIAIPMAKTALLALVIFHAQWVWNLLLWPHDPDLQPRHARAPQGIALFKGGYNTPYPEQLAVSVIACLPLAAALHLLLQILRARNRNDWFESLNRNRCQKRRKDMNILAFGAHPDDMELFCAGTLLKYAAAGHRIFFALATSGNQGSNILEGREEIARIREAEQLEAAKIYSAQVRFLRYDDEGLVENEDVRQKRAECGSLGGSRRHSDSFPRGHEHRPQRHSHNRQSNHAFPAWEKRKSRCPADQEIPSLFYWDTGAGIHFEPEVYVDITDVMDKKLKGLSSHKSQFDWMATFQTQTLSDFCRVISEFRGLQSGFRYAEGFRAFRNHGYMPNFKLAIEREDAGRGTARAAPLHEKESGA